MPAAVGAAARVPNRLAVSVGNDVFRRNCLFASSSTRSCEETTSALHGSARGPIERPLDSPLGDKIALRNELFDNQQGPFETMMNDRCIISRNDFVLLNALADGHVLAEELDKADVVDSDRVPPNIVTMNSRFVFEDEATGRRREVTIVLPEDADPVRGMVSVLAPVGTALLGLAENQSIVWPFPDGSQRRLRVVEVLFQPEADARLARDSTGRIDGELT
jgi:regulator of nucleoside diphosphate kinase